MAVAAITYTVTETSSGLSIKLNFYDTLFLVANATSGTDIHYLDPNEDTYEKVITVTQSVATVAALFTTEVIQAVTLIDGITVWYLLARRVAGITNGSGVNAISSSSTWCTIKYDKYEAGLTSLETGSTAATAYALFASEIVDIEVSNGAVTTNQHIYVSQNHVTKVTENTTYRTIEFQLNGTKRQLDTLTAFSAF